MDYDMITAQGYIIASYRISEGSEFMNSAPYQILEGSRFMNSAPYRILEGSRLLVSAPYLLLEGSGFSMIGALWNFLNNVFP